MAGGTAGRNFPLPCSQLFSGTSGGGALRQRAARTQRKWHGRQEVHFLAHRQSGFHKKTFAKENVANAAKAATDFFSSVLAQQKKRGKKRWWWGFVFPPSSASVTCIGATRAWCWPGRQCLPAVAEARPQQLRLHRQPELGPAWELVSVLSLCFRETKFWLPKIKSKKEKWIWPALQWFSFLLVCGMFQTPAQLPFEKKTGAGAKWCFSRLGLPDGYQ